MTASASKTTPFTIRFTGDERSDLERRAGPMALGAYIKCVLFDDGDKNKHRASRAPVKDQVTLAQVLAALGHSRVAEHLAALAFDARNGTLPVDEAVVAKLDQACEDILLMRVMLMNALGLETGQPPSINLTAAFNGIASVAGGDA